MGRHHQRKRKTEIIIVLFLLVVCLSFAFLAFKKDSEEKMRLQQLVTEEKEKKMPTDENSINVVTYATNATEESDGNLVISFESFLQNYSRTSVDYSQASVTYSLPEDVIKSDKVYVLSFKMRAEESAAKVRVNFGNHHTLYLTTAWQEYYVPCSEGQLFLASWTLLTDYQRIYLADVNILEYNDDVDLKSLKIGGYLVENSQTVMTDGLDIGITMDIAGDGEYLYSVGEETLTISRISDSGTKVISKLTGLGNVRHIELRDSNLAAVSSRENGIYLIDINDKEKPKIISHYDTLEIGNDVCFAGDYLFVAGRYFGLEIVDISNLQEPKYVTKIVNEKECFRCCVEGRYLFISCWGSYELEIYDISNIDFPEFVSSIEVDGKCAEAFIEGDYLYIAAGYIASENNSQVGEIGYATGNEMSIYNIEDIYNPVWCSTFKANGSMVGNGYDDWNVCVSNGFAFYTNSFNGVYIIDVQDPADPKLVDNIIVPVYSDSKYYRDLTKVSRTVFPYDANEFIISPAMGIYVDDSTVYFSGSYTDVYRYTFNEAKAIVKQDEDIDFNIVNKQSSKSSEESSYYITDYDAYSIVAWKDAYIVGTGEGILLLDMNMDIVDVFESEYPVKDLKITDDGHIITVEMKEVGIYYIENSKISKLNTIYSTESCCNLSQIELTGDCNYAIIQSSFTQVSILDLRDYTNLKWVELICDENGQEISLSNGLSLGNLYYKNLITGTVDGAVCVAGKSRAVWIESTGDSLRIRKSYPNVFSAEINGNAVLPDGEVLSIFSNGYYVYNPFTTEIEMIRDDKTKYTIENIKMKGKAIAIDDYLVLSNMPNSQIMILNIANVEHPSLLKTYNLNNTPGIAVRGRECILVRL